ncbi:helix-turn-helix transcriptional regulator [Agrobacterium salinitolerans]|nr:helix-turn-helix transcriptional regulator [Agrobacterium salinitolerans]
MGARVATSYDEDRLASISLAIGDAIDAAAMGAADWDAVPLLLAEAFPGTAPAINSQNVAEKTSNFQAGQNFDPDYLRSYYDYFAFINPWVPLWQRVESGRVLVSEKCSPARLFARSEFYNDWLLPQKDMEAACGVKIDGGPKNLVHMAVHYPLSCAPIYDEAIALVLGRISGNLQRAVRLGNGIRTAAEEAIAGAALVERTHHPAFVVDGQCRLRDANTFALELFASAVAATVRHGFVHVATVAADREFRNIVSSMAERRPVTSSLVSLETENGAWSVSLNCLPTVGGCSVGWQASRPMVLVLMRELGGRKANSASLSPIAKQFKLTPAEVLFCDQLIKGQSIFEAAANLGIAVDTARNRVKMIFRKTETHRQGELIAILTSFL